MSWVHQVKAAVGVGPRRNECATAHAFQFELGVTGEAWQRGLAIAATPGGVRRLAWRIEGTVNAPGGEL